MKSPLIKQADSKMTIVGIDPGAKTGIAWMQARPMQIEDVSTTTFWKAYHMLRRLAESDATAIYSTIVVIENGGAISPVVHEAANRRAQNMTSKRVGGNNRESDLLAEGIEELGYKVFRPAPRNTKKSAAFVRYLTGFEGKTNEHNRDAITMIWGQLWHLM